MSSNAKEGLKIEKKIGVDAWVIFKQECVILYEQRKVALLLYREHRMYQNAHSQQLNQAVQKTA